MSLILKGLFHLDLPTPSPNVVKRVERDCTLNLFPVNVKIKLEEYGKMPQKAHDTDAAFDLFANLGEDEKAYIEIPPHETVKVSAGFSAEVPQGYVGHIWARSGISTKEGLRPANCVGVADASYRGVYTVAVHNDSTSTRYVKNGERIAQLTIDPVIPVNLIQLKDGEELSETDRGATGFGDSGKF